MPSVRGHSDVIPHDLAAVLLLPSSGRTARQSLSLRVQGFWHINYWLRGTASEILAIPGAIDDFRGHLCRAYRSGK